MAQEEYVKKEFQKLRTGVIGVGSMGINHARVYSEISNLVCVVDSDEKRGRRAAELYGVDWYPNYHKIIGKVDAVSIAVPTSLHLEVSKALLDEGINILVEKPLAGNMEDAEELVNLSNHSKAILAVGHIERHNPVVKYAKESILAGSWGNLLTISAKRFSNYPSRIVDVGVIHDLSIHDIDIISYLAASEIEFVYANGGSYNKSNDFEDFVHISLKYKNGIIGLCETNWLTPMKIRETHITTDKNYVVMDYINQTLSVGSSSYGNIDTKNLFETPIDFKIERVNIEKKEPLLNELCDFLESITTGRSPLVNAEEGFNAVRVADLCHQEIKNNHKLRFD